MSARKSLPSQRRRRLKLYRRKDWLGSSARMRFTVSTTLAPGWRFDIEDDGRLPIEPARHPAVLDAVADGADIPQPNRRAVAISDGWSSGRRFRQIVQASAARAGGRARTERLPVLRK